MLVKDELFNQWYYTWHLFYTTGLGTECLIVSDDTFKCILSWLKEFFFQITWGMYPENRYPTPTCAPYISRLIYVIGNTFAFINHVHTNPFSQPKVLCCVRNQCIHAGYNRNVLVASNIRYDNCFTYRENRMVHNIWHVQLYFQQYNVFYSNFTEVCSESCSLIYMYIDIYVYIYIYICTSPGLNHLTHLNPHYLGFFRTHYSDVIMGTMVSQITSLTIVYSTIYSGASYLFSNRSRSFKDPTQVCCIHSNWAIKQFARTLQEQY